MIRKHYALQFVIVLIGILACLTMFFPAFPQPLSYHDFADKRVFLGIEHASDVLSNLFYLLFGVWGLKVVLENHLQKTSQGEYVLWGIFFGSSILVSFFSGYYHLSPDNLRLVFDRLAISLMFMSFFSLMITERLSKKLGLKIAPYLLILGVSSVVYWITTELQGAGDLRFYVFMQLSPFAMMLPLIAFFPSIHKNTGYLYSALALYASAVLCENYDKELFDASCHVISGHTLKHLLSSLSVFALIFYLKKRKNPTKKQKN